jgi:hypothetical protein
MDLSRQNMVGFLILIKMGLHKFKHLHAEHAIDFGNSIFRLKNTRIKSSYF